MTQDQTRTPMIPRGGDPTAVRQGVTLGVMRYVLALSLVLAVAAMAFLWIALRG